MMKGPSWLASRPGSAAEHTMVQVIHAFFWLCFGACSGQCCIGIDAEWSIVRAACAGCMPKGIIRTATSAKRRIRADAIAER